MKKSSQPWQVLAKSDALTTQWFTIVKQAMRTPRGRDATYYVHHADDSVICFCVTADHKILIERQYRPPVQKISIDFPAGKMEASDANSLQAIRRELREEAGFIADDITKLAVLDKDPGFSATRLHVFLARGHIATATTPDVTEDIALAFVTPAQLLDLVHSGQICCTYCVSTTFLALSKLNWLTPSMP